MLPEHLLHLTLGLPPFYSGHEAPSLKMGPVFLFFCCCFCLFVCSLVFFFWGGGWFLVLCWLGGTPPMCHQCHLAKNEIWVSGVYFASWLYELFVRTLMSHTDAYAGCSRPTLNVIERFELGSLHSDTVQPLHQLVSLGHKQKPHMYTDYVASLACLSLYYSMRHK